MGKEFFKNKVEKVILVAGHSLIMGHLPEKIGLIKMANKLSTNPSQELGSFGLFDSSSPNYTTYYPEVTQEDLKPKDSDFIEPVFRMLSNTVVQHRYNPIEFPEDILKASMPKLVGLTVNVDHETSIGNGIGVIKSVEWQNEYKVGSFTVPAGINAVLKIDGKSNPRLARGIMMDPPSINSNSVTVGFTWQPSHPTMDEQEFYSKLGSFDKDGKLVRKIATEIKFYRETSLVGAGADPFAQLIKDGKIVNPHIAKSREPISKKSLSDKDKDFSTYALLDWKNPENLFELSLNSLEEETEENNNQNETNMELLRFLETLFGFEAESLTDENYEEKLNAIGVKLTSLSSEVETLKNKPIEIEGLTGEVAIAEALKELSTLKAEIPEGETITNLVKFSKVGKDSIQSLRDDTVRLYKLSLKGKAEDAAIINLINSSEEEALTGLHTQYNSLTEDDLQFVCLDCDSHNVSRATSKPNEGGEHVEKSTHELIEKFTANQPAKFTMYKGKS